VIYCRFLAHPATSVRGKNELRTRGHLQEDEAEKEEQDHKRRPIESAL
jgi:hypothetical protein